MFCPLRDRNAYLNLTEPSQDTFEPGVNEEELMLNDRMTHLNFQSDRITRDILKREPDEVLNRYDECDTSEPIDGIKYLSECSDLEKYFYDRGSKILQGIGYGEGMKKEPSVKAYFVPQIPSYMMQEYYPRGYRPELWCVRKDDSDSIILQRWTTVPGRGFGPVGRQIVKPTSSFEQSQKKVDSDDNNNAPSGLENSRNNIDDQSGCANLEEETYK